MQVVFPLVAMVAVGWLLIIIGFGIETNQPQVLLPVPVDTRIGASIRYSWWMVIFVTPGMLVMAVIQAAIDSNRLAMNIIGAAVSYLHRQSIYQPLRMHVELLQYIILNFCDLADNFSQCSIFDSFRFSSDYLWTYY